MTQSDQALASHERKTVAIVSGGGTGLGRSICLALGESGYAVVLVYSRSRDEAFKTVEMLRTRGTRAAAIKTDVSIAPDVARAVAQVVDDFGRVDALVNSAGATVRVAFGDIESIDDVTWDRIFAVNLKGTWLMSKEVAKIMRSQDGGGVIVNVASTAGLVPVGSSLPYAVSKAAVIHLTRCLAVALAPQVRVNAVAPGFMPTRWNEGTAETGETGYRDRSLLRTIVPVHDVVSAVMELVGNRSVTGQVWTVDAGFTIV